MKRLTLFMLAIVFLLCACGGEEKSDIYNYIKTLEDLDKYIIVGTYTGVEVETITVTDNDVESRVAEYQEEHSYFKKLEKTKIEAGDHVHISYSSTLDGQLFDGGAGEDDLFIGEGEYDYREVEIALLGAEVGSIHDIKVTLPDDYYSIGLRGKTIVMKVTVVQIQESDATVPELTDDFVKEYYDKNTVAEFKEAVRKELEREAEDEMYTAAWDAALDNCEMIEYPDGIVEKYVAEMREYYTEEAKKYGAELSYIVGDVEAWEKEATQFAEDYYKSEIAMYYILDKEFGRDISSAEYAERLADYAEENGMTTGELKKKYSKDELVTFMHWDKVMEFIWDNATKI